MDFATILDPQVSVRGAKYALISTNKLHGDSKLRLTIGDKILPTSTPFGVSTFNNDDATRKNIEFTIGPSDEAKINDIYNWALEYLASKSDNFFKKPQSFISSVSKAELIELFKHPIVKKEKYEPRLKCKIDLSGKNQVRCWDANNEKCALPSDLRGYKLIPRVCFNHVWFMSKECGFVVLVTDLQILECPDEECPFE
jgi:hypothetical protein